MSLQNWLRSNVNVMPPNTSNMFYHDDPNVLKEARAANPKPWAADPHYIQRIYLSAIALLKMVVHGKSGHIGPHESDWVEVAGRLQGHFVDHAIVLTDSYGIPVFGNAVEITDNSVGEEFCCNFRDDTELMGRHSKVFGWYHTHPGLSCFLSGVDVNSQRTLQLVADPVVALVLDPVRTLVNGRVDIKAFRTYPKTYKPSQENIATRREIDATLLQEQAEERIALDAQQIFQSREKAYHDSQYYEVPITIFRSQNDAILLEQLFHMLMPEAFRANPLVRDRSFVNSELAAVTNQILQERNKLLLQRASYNATKVDENSEPLFVLPSRIDKANNKQNNALLGSSNIKASNIKGLNTNIKKNNIVQATMNRIKLLGEDAEVEMNIDEEENDNNGSLTFHDNSNYDLIMTRNVGIDILKGLIVEEIKNKIFN